MVGLLTSLRWFLQRPWWVLVLAIDVVFLFFTFYVMQGLPMEFWLRPLSLGTEQSVATWWSGVQLLVFALLMHELSRVAAKTDRMAARGLLALGLAGLLLYWDEVGSIHERAELLSGFTGIVSVLPLAILGGGLVGYGLWVLVRRREFLGQAWWRVSLAFLVFAFVLLQEVAEHGTGLPRWLAGSPITGEEEGTELLGMFLLLAAGVYLMHRFKMMGPDQTSVIHLFPGRHTMIWFVKACAILAVPLVVIWSSYSVSQLGADRGHFVNTISVAAYFLSAVIALRTALAAPETARRWGVLALILVILSLDAECAFHRYLWHDDESLRLRRDIGLLWGVPLLFISAVFVPRLNCPRLKYGAAGVMILVVATVLAPFQAIHSATPVIVSLLVLVWLLASVPAPGGEASTGPEARAWIRPS